MIIEEIELHNFGVFGGRQRIVLAPPAKSKPVVLFGGLNGAGKTTLLEAMQLVLYGRQAATGRRGELPYDEYLRRLIHRRANPREGASVQVVLRVSEDGQSRKLRVRRTWSDSGSRVVERLEVFRDDEADNYLSETWSDYVARLIPPQLSELFFFDGERIEELADPAQSQNILRSAVHALLGVDLVKQLQQDLLVVNRRKLVEQRPGPERSKVQAAEAEVTAIESKLTQIRQEVSSAKGKFDQAEAKLRQADADFARQGGDLAARRSAVEQQLATFRAQRGLAETKLRELAAGPLPLMVVRSMLQSIKKQAALEAEAVQAQLVERLAVDRDQRILRQLQEEMPEQAIVARIASLLERDREANLRTPDTEPYLGVDDNTRHRLEHLLEHHLTAAADAATEILKQLAGIAPQIDDAERQLAAVPDADAIARSAAAQADARRVVDDKRSQLAKRKLEEAATEAELELKQKVLRDLHDAVHEAEVANEEVIRFVRHAEGAREVLDSFAVALTAKHAERLAKNILESFQRLLRKQALVHDIRIDPATCRLTLLGAEDQELASERLSAGERQLLAVSILWGLARATGRSLPVIVDTPLGRLDTEHRMRLVQRYFPLASHQVILLSTDEEITDEYYAALKPKVGRCYRITHEDTNGSSVIEAGYFGQEVAL